ncbi:hypothetical protein L1987_63977 [Smallanthus sonchifolius]|uniref:Uncharacterized protein n=1 Tax=Smallanthus sonchifolius TaxID=185202 RepID=A0ACB9CET4_9ASTR|nr:hypothetical protein L1987_63977 [Smallanthus sonchifolius]
MDGMTSFCGSYIDFLLDAWGASCCKSVRKNYLRLRVMMKTIKSILEVAIWLGWKPIPYWLCKLHGLGQIDTEKVVLKPFIMTTCLLCTLRFRMSAWKRMAQVLSEANFGNVQQILEIGPPKWLPDSCATARTLRSWLNFPREQSIITIQGYIQGGGEFADLIIVLRSEEAVKTFNSDIHVSFVVGLSAALGVF